MKYWLYTLILLISNNIISQKKELTLEDAIINRYGSLAPTNYFDLQWIPNSNLYSYTKNNTLLVQNNKGKTIKSLSLEKLNHILGTSLQRMPFLSLKNSDIIEFTDNGKTKLISINKGRIISSKNSPIRGENFDISSNGVYAYTVKNNLYVFDKKEIAVTNDTNKEHVYGQSISRSEFGITKGTFWSPKGNYLAFYCKDETHVKNYPLVNYTTDVAQMNAIKYPMAGKRSEQVKLGIYNLKTKNIIYIKKKGNKEGYLTNITWSPNEKHIYIQELNRKQNHMKLNKYDAKTGDFIHTLFEEKSKTYVEPLHTLIFSKVNTNHFYLLSNKDGFYHIYKYHIDGRQLAQLTTGNWEVTEIIGFDKREKTIYFTGTKTSPLERHLYQVNTKSKKINRLTKKSGTHSISMSSKGAFFIDKFQSTKVPNIINLLDKKGNKIKNILTSKDNSSDYIFGSNKIVEVPCPDGKNTLYGRIILPTNFDKNKKYPVIVYVYGGPHSQLVRKTWKNAARWWQYYMAQKGYISFTLDNRGTQNRGRKFEDVIHRNLGINETADQMAGINYLKSLPYVDTDRIGVHGWSFGGFMTMNLMMRHPNIFKVGVAGGPVVDWSMYEVMYGERYMDTPQENPKGYRRTDMSSLIPNLKGNLLVIHGTQDPVVVMQHSMKFLRECIIQNKQVDFFTYPTHEHNVRGKDRVHLMRKVSDYFLDKL